MTDPADMIVPLLREMRSENLTLHERTQSKLLTGEFEERIEALENKVRELEGHK
jgi:hypothetical protein